MEKEQRTRLQKATQDARRLLEEEFRSQLLQTYDIDVDKVRWAEEPGAHLLAEQRLIREKLIAWIEHKEAQINDRKEALLLALREMAFTALNRFVALKLMEARELVRPCVSGGLESVGFLEFTAVAQGLLADQESSYRLYLETIFEDVSRELRALFDPRDPASLLWPKRAALLVLLDILSRPELGELWREDETLGWVYQYFNGDAERKKMREESAAPRNSRELAVRNQFFTPRYVVEFLTDNTLGRIWYEMRQGNTGLKDRCRYLVQRPVEIWLQPGEEVHAQPERDEALSQEELLLKPVHIPHRELKDPREIRMLDPACGSMHFGLYAFDLYLEIYTEAWEIAQGFDGQVKQAEAFASFADYAAGFASKAVFLREVPKLILQYNIHGIDIDPRATQIARLTLWLRAQKTWQEQRLDAVDRPPITRSNVVCAEPMPGKRELLADFVDRQFPDAEGGLVQQLLDAIFDKMQLAGEAGSLLKIEEEIRDAIDQARSEWQKLEVQQRDLFSAAELTALGQVGFALNTDLQNLTNDFWIDIEERIYTALSDYADQAETSRGFQRRLFAEDAAGGFAFIDISRKKYDVSVMNPPFGDSAATAKHYLAKTYKGYSVELYCSFLMRCHELLEQGGIAGCITSSSFVLYTDFSEYREALLSLMRLESLVSLGEGVLDGAYVYTASYVTMKSEPSSLSAFYDLRVSCQKESDLLGAIKEPSTELPRYLRPSYFNSLPSKPLCHWASDALFNLARRAPKLESHLIDAGVGAAPQSDFYSLYWEVPASMTGISKKWTPIVNGGSFSPFGRTDFLVADWEDGGSRAIADLNNRYPYLNGNVGLRIQRTSLYGQRGLTYGKRSDRFNAQVLREGSIFTFEGIGIFPSDNSSEFLFGLLAILNSRFVAYWLNLTAGLHKNDVYIRRLPFPFSRDEVRNLAPKGQRAHALMTEAIATEETNHFFTGKTFGALAGTSLRQLGEEFRIADRRNEVELFTVCHEIEAFLAEACLLDDKVAIEISIDQGPDPCSFESRLPDEPFSIPAKVDKGRPGFCRWFEASSDLYRLCIDRSIHPAAACAALNKARVVENEVLAWLSQGLLSYGVGCIFGRWDIRYATGEQPAPKLPDPFSPLPFCPLGQLQNSQGLPIQPEDMPSTYPVRISWVGIFVDDSNHPLDIVRRVREVIEVIWSGHEPSSSSETIEQEACVILNVKSLRDYFRKPTGFFAEHLKCYSKSRRQAPIYWQLSAGNGSYSVWLYYHRLTQDTLYRVQRDFVEPRIQHAEREKLEYETQGALSGDAATRLQEAHTLLQDLRSLRSELDLVAPIWNPNLNDGVIINHAILWRITPYTPWQKKCKECWDKLAKGDYDWSHLAFHLWPERVIRKCQSDRSLAIAHGLEELLWQETNKGNGLPRQLSEAELQALISEHTKPAVKNALERFLAAPPPAAPARPRASRSTRSSGSSAPRRPRGTAAVVDAEATRQVLLALTDAPSDGLAKTSIADLIGVEANALTAVIKQLKESGQIDQLGERRGARYVLSEQGRAAVASETEVEA